MKRSLQLCLILCVSFFTVEAYLRLTPGLPSVRATMVPFQPNGRPSVVSPSPDTPGCTSSDAQDKPVGQLQTYGPGTTPGLRILFAGDSITLGEGVELGENYTARLGMRLSAKLDERVEVMNAGVNAAGYCHVIRAVHGHLAEREYDHVVIGFFADDLEQRAVTLRGDEVRADPRGTGGLVGSFASTSYLFNWVWFQIVKWVVQNQTDGGQHPVANIVRSGRQIPVRTLDNFSASINGLKKYEPIFLLIPPVGGPLCPAEPETGSECDWFETDMQEMADRLSASGMPFIDLRGLWSDGVDHTQPLERRWWREHQRLPVHPNADGHQRISDAIIHAWRMP